MSDIFVILLMTACWAFNIVMWVRGFYLTFASFQIPKDGGTLEKLSTGVNNLGKAFYHFVFTMGDIGAVGLVRFLVGTYASTMLVSSLLSVIISVMIQLLRSGKTGWIFDPKDI